MLDLSASFDEIDNFLLLEYSYGTIRSALSGIKSYLNNRRQCMVVGAKLSEYLEIKFGVPEGS